MSAPVCRLRKRHRSPQSQRRSSHCKTRRDARPQPALSKPTPPPKRYDAALPPHITGRASHPRRLRGAEVPHAPRASRRASRHAVFFLRFASNSTSISCTAKDIPPPCPRRPAFGGAKGLRWHLFSFVAAISLFPTARRTYAYARVAGVQSAKALNRRFTHHIERRKHKPIAHTHWVASLAAIT